MPDHKIDNEQGHKAPIPEGLRKQLEDFKKRLWQIKIAEAAVTAGQTDHLVMLFATFFSDDFVTHKNKSVWIFTVTLSPKATQKTSVR